MYKVKEVVLEFGHIFMLSKSTFKSICANYNTIYLSCYELVVLQDARRMNAYLYEYQNCILNLKTVK
jgi:hypothetical protein